MGELHQKSPDLSGPYGRYVYITRTYQIPGGVAIFYGERHTIKYRDYQGIFVIFTPAHRQLLNHKLYYVAQFRHISQNVAI